MFGNGSSDPRKPRRTSWALCPDNAGRTDRRPHQRNLAAFLNKQKRAANSASYLKLTEDGQPPDPGLLDYWGDLTAVIPREIYPDTLVLQRGDRLFDYNGSPIGLVISQAFRDAVEAFAPGLHQFSAVRVVKPDGTALEGQTRYIFRVRQPLSSVRPEVSTGLYPVAKDTRLGDVGPFHVRADAWISFRKAVCSAAGIWRERRIPVHDFVSDALVARLRAIAPECWETGLEFSED